MFTGIITAVGRVAEVRALGASSAHGKQLVIETPPGYLDDVGLGDSIALNGACMTATAIDAQAGRFAIDISAESLARTAGLDRPGPVNLEKALRAHDRLGGHIVSGHVDAGQLPAQLVVVVVGFVERPLRRVALGAGPGQLGIQFTNFAWQAA